MLVLKRLLLYLICSQYSVVSSSAARLRPSSPVMTSPRCEASYVHLRQISNLVSSHKLGITNFRKLFIVPEIFLRTYIVFFTTEALRISPGCGRRPEARSTMARHRVRHFYPAQSVMARSQCRPDRRSALLRILYTCMATSF